MLKWLAKNKWLALGMVAIMLFTLLPTNLNWADVAVTEPSTEELDTAFMTEETASKEEVTTEEVKEDTQTGVTTELDATTQTDATDNEGEDITTEAGSEGATEVSAPSVSNGEVLNTEAVTEAPVTTEADDKKIATMAGEIETYADSGSSYLLDNSTFHLENVYLDATWTDEDGMHHIESEDLNGQKIPSDAELSLYFDFVIIDGTMVEPNKEYIYEIPDELYVNLQDAVTHPLMDEKTGDTIGSVSISPDGTMTFVFNENATKASNIGFYVKFKGGFSSEGTADGKDEHIEFPADGGKFEFDLTLTEPGKKEEDKEPGELGVQKWGNEVKQGNDGKPFIEWTIELDLNGRDELTADITDVLPAGLKYAKVAGYPKLSGEGNFIDESTDGKVSIHVEDVKGPGKVYLTFCTYYDETIFKDDVIRGYNGIAVNNEVYVEEEDANTGVSGKGTAYVKPDVLSKTGEIGSDGKIKWTVVINQDCLDIAGAIYTDTLQPGHKMDGTARDIAISPPNAGSITEFGTDGFKFTVDGNWKGGQIILTYYTTAEDLTQESYKNQGTLKKDGDIQIDASTSAEVKQYYPYVKKEATGKNDVTKEFYWTITVNPEPKYDFGEGEVTLTDIFNKLSSTYHMNEMKLISMKIRDQESLEADGVKCTKTADGFTFTNLGEHTVVIEVVTQMLDKKASGAQDALQEGEWVGVDNYANLQWTDDSGAHKVEKKASQQIQYKEPELITKDGKMNGDGTIDWTIYYTYHANTEQESILITDELPDGLVFVEGSIVMYERYHEWDKDNWVTFPNSVIKEGGKKLEINIDENNYPDYLTKSFEIHYKTRVTDVPAVGENRTYKNSAEATVDFANDIEVTDKAFKDVTGEVGGKLGKEAKYTSGEDVVEWIVTINKGHYEMGPIKNPEIRDTLAEYFTYVGDSAELYRIEEGKEPVLVTGITVTVVNNEMVVTWPEIRLNETYEFHFKTRFNVRTEAALLGVSIKNTVSFTGKGESESVTSDEVKNVHFDSSSAGAYMERELRVYKKDSNNGALILSKATFKLYGVRDDGSAYYITTAETDERGCIPFKGIGPGKYILEEITPPDGYEIDSEATLSGSDWEGKKGVYEIVITSENDFQEEAGTVVRHYDKEIDNPPISNDVSFSIHKTGEKGRNLAGAGFTVYSAQGCADTDVVSYKETKTDGVVTFTVEYEAGETTHYYVKETKVPGGYLDAGVDDTVYHFMVDGDGNVTCEIIKNGTAETIDLTNNVLTVSNTKAKGQFKLAKVIAGKLADLEVDIDTINSAFLIDGVQFTLYSDELCNDEVVTKKTENGIIVFDDLIVGHTYYYRETKVPNGYVLDETVHSITIGEKDAHENVTVTAIVENKEAKGFIKITKTDNTAKANKLEGAKFTLYDANGALFPNPKDGRTPWTLTTGSDGVVVFDELPFGTYIVKEESAPEGYVAIIDEDGINVTVDTTKGNNITVVNDVGLVNLKIVKKDGKDMKPLVGVSFQLRSNGQLKGSGTTDSSGTITFRDLPYGDYTITETKPLPGYKAISPINVTIGENSSVDGKNVTIDPETNTITVSIENEKESGNIKFKKCLLDEKGEQVTDSEVIKGAVFNVYDSRGELVATVSPDENGVVYIKDLIYDTYTVREVQPPEGYKLDATVWTVTVESDDDYTLDVTGTVTNDGNLTVVNNHLIEIGIKYMSFELNKVDLNGNAVELAEFELSRSYDGGKIWESLGVAYADKNGIVKFHDIYIQGDDEEPKRSQVLYKVEEISLPYGYKKLEDYEAKVYTYDQLPGARMDGVDIGHGKQLSEYEDGEKWDIPSILDVENEKVFGQITVIKSGSKSVNKLNGAEFTLYKYDAATSKYVVYEKDGKPYVVTTGEGDNETGYAVFKDLPAGTYRIMETKPPKGYILNSVMQAPITIPGKDDNKLSYMEEFKDTAIDVSVSKFATSGSSTSGSGETQLTGATLALYDAKDYDAHGTAATVLDKWNTVNIAHKLDYSILQVGNTYVLHELKAPKGYKRSEDVRFTINSDGSLTWLSGKNSNVDNSAITKAVIMRDEPISLKINKVGMAKDGDVSTAPSLSGAKISLIDEKTKTVVHTIYSQESAATVPYGVLSIPESAGEYTYYTIHEDSAPGGYARSDDIRIAIDYDGKIYTVDKKGVLSELTNNTVTMVDVEYVDLYFSKIDDESKKPLPGAKFTITSNNPDSDFEPYTWVSTNAPENVQLPEGKYTFTEVEAPNGYKLEESIEFEVKYDENDKAYIEVSEGHDSSLSTNHLTLTSSDPLIEVWFAKYGMDGNTFKSLTGGKFVLYACDDKWTQGEKLGEFEAAGGAIRLTNTYFKLGGYYVLVEEETPDETLYTPADPIYFSIDMKGQAWDKDGNAIASNLINCINGEKVISFQKIDAVTKEAMADVELKITDETGENVVEPWTTNGSEQYFKYSTFEEGHTYTLSETKTKDGYSYAAPITFEVAGGKLYVGKEGQELELRQTLNIVMENQPFAVSVDKYVLDTTQYLPGATLQILDASGNILEQWQTDGKTHPLDTTKFKASTADTEYVYTLKETAAPELYALAQPIEFTIDSSGVVKRVDGEAVTNNKLVMYDEYKGLAFSKQDVGGKEIAGATLTITSTEDTTFKPLTWESTTTPKNWSQDLFKVGMNYILTETVAPNGYSYAESVVFRIDDTGVIYVNGSPVLDKTIKMIDNPLQLQIEKRVDGTKKFLAGAKLSIIEEATGTAVYSWKSGETAKSIPADKLRASSDTEKIIYILRETKAPKGYEIAKDIRFYIDKAGNVYTLNKANAETIAANYTITMYDEKSDEEEEEEEETGTKTTSKKTGDGSPIAMAGVLFFLSLAGAGVTVTVRRRKKK